MLKKELLAKAKELGIKGRSKLTKPQLIDAIKEAGGDVEDDKKGDGKQKKIDQMYKVDTPPVKKVVKKADPSPKMQKQFNQEQLKQKLQKQAQLKQNQMVQSKMSKMSPKIQTQLKAKMVEVAEGKK